ncbi:MAG: nucleotide pyrophosphohydrolase [Bacteroidota bacterium]
MAEDIKDIIEALIKFRDERDWKQFHDAKDLALALSIEASELNELFLWKLSENVDVAKLKHELADVFTFAFLLAEKYGLNVKQIVMDKIALNADRYPISKSKGNANKYNDL